MKGLMCYTPLNVQSRHCIHILTKCVSRNSSALMVVFSLYLMVTYQDNNNVVLYSTGYSNGQLSMAIFYSNHAMSTRIV